jgi:hypothetical protein
MANNDRDRRLLDASVLHDAIDALSKVKEEQRIEFIHDRMMSAIDDICKTHQGTGKEKFSAAQINILKDIIFHVIYVLDTRNRPSRGFFRRLLDEFWALTPMKQIGISVATITVLGSAGVSIVGGYKSWLLPPLEYLNVIQKSSETKPAQQSISSRVTGTSSPPTNTLPNPLAGFPQPPNPLSSLTPLSK